MIRGKERVRARSSARRILVTSAVLVAFVATGYQEADSRRPEVNPVGASAVSSASARDAAVATGGAGASVEPAPLYAVPSSPFIHDARQGTFIPEAEGDARHLTFSNGIEIDTRAGAPSLPAGLTLDAAPTDRPGYHIVQFEGPIRESWRAELEATGAKVIGYVPEYAYIIRADSRQLEAAGNLAHVVWSGLYQPAYKVSAQPELAASSGRTQVLLLLFPGESLGDMESVVADGGGVVLEDGSASRFPVIRAEIDLANLAALARRTEVMWIEHWKKPQLYNDRCQWVLQTWSSGNRKIWDHGLTGAGQVIGNCDSGINVAHNQFRDALVPMTDFGDYPTHRKVIAYHESVPDAVTFGDASWSSYHGTHTNCTMAGNDAPFAADLRDGMAKDAKIWFMDGGSATDGIYVPADLYGLLLDPYTGNAGGAARIMSNSWGSSGPGTYTAQSMQVDEFMWDHKDFLACFSAGNDGLAGIGSPATSKDCWCAGGTLNGTSATSLYTATSRGPCADGRQKPDGNTPASLSSARGSTTTGYWTLSGTSMACPAAAGSMTLVRQYFTDGWYPTGAATAGHGFNPSAALVKSMFLNGTHNDISGYTAPDNNIGWGRPDLDRVLYFPGDSRSTVIVDHPGLITGEYAEYQVYVAGTGQDLRISLAWTDYPGMASVSPALVNDLNLLVTDPSGSTTYLGNVFSSGQSQTGGSADVLNNVECVWRTVPAVGNWTIRIEAPNVPVGPQPFALVASGDLGGDAGTVTLDRGYYNDNATIQIRVEDLNASPGFQVAVTSDTETTPEMVTMSALAAVGEGIFTGSIETTLFGATHGDGKISVTHGDQIHVTYNDTSPSHSSSAVAEVRLEGVVISDVALIDASSTAATIGWTSSRQATSQMYYGPTPALGSVSALDENQVTSHTHTVTGLDPNTTYYYEVESVDNYGNVVRDDNGGNQYTFTTREKGDVLLVVSDNTFGETDKYRAAFLRSGWTWDEAPEGFGYNPLVGDLNTGMRSYPAVWWQVGWEQYPPFTDAARGSISAYTAGGARISYVSHDVMWAFGDATSGFQTPENEAWMMAEMHADWTVDPTTFGNVRGFAGDPISGAYTTAITYSAFRAGGSGDEITPLAGTGTVAVPWEDTRFAGFDCSTRWESGGPLGSPSEAVWGGQPTRAVGNFFEWSRLNPTVADDPVRADVLSKTLAWLIGRLRPDVAVVAPNGGENFTGTSVSVSWTETAHGGTSIASRRIEYSDNSGASWHVITGSPGTSPYSWDISSLPNAATYQVRVVAEDDGSPVLTGIDASDADFTINRPGGDTRGPVVRAGSQTTTPNPPLAPANFTLTATLDDTHTGNSNIAAAEWSMGAHALPAGSGSAMGGIFGVTPVANVSASIDPATVAGGVVTFWVRGKDSAGSWGTADSIKVVVNGGATSVAEGAGAPAVFALGQNVPNPFNPETVIRFSVRQQGPARLTVYDVAGRAVRTLVDGNMPAGAHEVRWNGLDSSGRKVASGVYFYRLESADQNAVRKMVLMK